jgi:hypothetical protein
MGSCHLNFVLLAAALAIGAHLIHREPAGTKRGYVSVELRFVAAKLGAYPCFNRKSRADGKKLFRGSLRQFRFIGLLIRDCEISEAESRVTRIVFLKGNDRFVRPAGQAPLRTPLFRLVEASNLR